MLIGENQREAEDAGKVGEGWVGHISTMCQVLDLHHPIQFPQQLIVILTTNSPSCLLCVRHCDNCFTYSNSVNTSNNPEIDTNVYPI